MDTGKLLTKRMQVGTVHSIYSNCKTKREYIMSFKCSTILKIHNDNDVSIFEK